MLPKEVVGDSDSACEIFGMVGAVLRGFHDVVMMHGDCCFSRVLAAIIIEFCLNVNVMLIWKWFKTYVFIYLCVFIVYIYNIC